MRHNALPSLDALDAMFNVSFELGELYRRSSKRTDLIGCAAGWVSSRGYRKIKISGVAYPAHRIIYALYHRVDPGDMEIDHVNGVFDDNRITNLRLVTRAVNCANRKSWRDGPRGAYKKGNIWMAIIQIDNVRQYLGSFATEEAAHAAFSAVAVGHYGTLARLD